MSTRPELLGEATGLARAADLAESWADLTADLVAATRKRASTEAIAEFAFALGTLDTNLLHAHVSQYAAQGLTGFARTLRALATGQAGEALGPDDDRTPTSVIEMPPEALRDDDTD